MAIAHLTRRLDKIESKALANHPRIVFVKAMIPSEAQIQGASIFFLDQEYHFEGTDIEEILSDAEAAFIPLLGCIACELAFVEWILTWPVVD